MTQYELLRGDVSLGIVTVDPAECDFPWKGGRLEPTADFAEIMSLFREFERLLDAEDLGAACESAHERIMEPGICLRPLDGGEPEEIMGIRIDAEHMVQWR
jgi:hypothetical protein